MTDRTALRQHSWAFAIPAMLCYILTISHFTNSDARRLVSTRPEPLGSQLVPEVNQRIEQAAFRYLLQQATTGQGVRVAPRLQPHPRPPGPPPPPRPFVKASLAVLQSTPQKPPSLQKPAPHYQSNPPPRSPSPSPLASPLPPLAPPSPPPPWSTQLSPPSPTLSTSSSLPPSPPQPPAPPSPASNPPVLTEEGLIIDFPTPGNTGVLGANYSFPNLTQTDPSIVGQFVLKRVGNVVAIHLMQVPGTEKFFFMERPSGRHPDKGRNIVGTYDYAENTFTNIYYYDAVFCAGHTVTQGGHILVVGGHLGKGALADGLKAVRMFNRKTLTFQRIANMSFPRWYPTATLLPNGKVTIMGGTVLPGSGTPKNPVYEIWDPAKPLTMEHRNQSLGLITKTNDIYYPNNYVLPTGDMFIFCGKYGEIMEPNSGLIRTLVPTFPIGFKSLSTEYPYTGVSVMLPLTPENGYTPEVVYFGGQYLSSWVNTTASNVAFRIKVQYDSTAGNYTFGSGWVAEEMPLPRVMGDAVVLPNGRVVVLNGAVKGLAGDSAAGGAAKANEPNIWPVLYDPKAPRGSRFRVMTPSRIPRLYHSTAVLTTDGSVLVAGCDRCDRFWWTTPGSILKSPTSFAEYRIEVFRPPSWFNVLAKPEIISISNSTWDDEDNVNVLQYDAPFTLQYSMFYAEDRVTGVVLVAPGSTTHSTNMNQRVVGLEILEQDVENRTLLIRGPPTYNIAPPGWYMLFLLNGDTYGRSKWVRLPGTAPRLDEILKPDQP